jgi:hypothetical protein
MKEKVKERRCEEGNKNMSRDKVEVIEGRVNGNRKRCEIRGNRQEMVLGNRIQGAVEG